MQTYTFTKLTVFRQCPRRYFYRYVAKTPPCEQDRSMGRFFGQLFREALENIHRQQQEGFLPTPDEAVARFLARWTLLLDDSIKIRDDKTILSTWRDAGVQMLRDYVSRGAVPSDERIIGVELPVTVHLDDSVRLRSKIALLTVTGKDQWRVRRFLSDAKLPETYARGGDEGGPLHRIAVEQRFPESSGKIELISEYLTLGQVVIRKPGDAEINLVGLRVRGLIADIASRPTDERAFATVKSEYCNRCEFQHVCPVMRAGYVRAPIPSEGDWPSNAAAKLVDAWVEKEEFRGDFLARLAAVDTDIRNIQRGLVQIAEREGWQRVMGTRHEAIVTSLSERTGPRRKDEPIEAMALNKEIRGTAWWDQLSVPSRRAIDRAIRDPATPPALAAILARFAVQRKTTTVQLTRRRP